MRRRRRRELAPLGGSWRLGAGEETGEKRRERRAGRRLGGVGRGWARLLAAGRCMAVRRGRMEARASCVWRGEGVRSRGCLRVGRREEPIRTRGVADPFRRSARQGARHGRRLGRLGGVWSCRVVVRLVVSRLVRLGRHGREVVVEPMVAGAVAAPRGANLLERRKRAIELGRTCQRRLAWPAVGRAVGLPGLAPTGRVEPSKGGVEIVPRRALGAQATIEFYRLAVLFAYLCRAPFLRRRMDHGRAELARKGTGDGVAVRARRAEEEGRL